ncbi:MAG: FecR domain-containing protein [Sphingomonas sp.]|jgi:tetratricopeptide (TPR) repeat protein|uniref:FecR domain-containing protein n=1 Tax=Sphingomonas sp. TaxID=28214 RepID=UPI003568D7E7
MRRGLFGISVIALTTGSQGQALAQAVPRVAPISGAIVAAKGGEQATLVPERHWRPAVTRQQLKAGDVLRTNGAGTLAIVFADRTQIRLGRNSVLAVKAVSAGVPSSLQLQQGRVWARSPSGRTNLSVETPSATAAIRGTEWSLAIEGDATALQVFSGEVRFFNEAGTLDVAQGQAASARVGQAPTRTILADPVGREQMLYFLRPEDGVSMMRGRSPAFAAYVRALRAGESPTDPPFDPADPLSWVGAGFLAAYRGDLADAQRIAVDGLQRFPDEPGLYELQARTALLRGDGALAAQAVESALERNPRDPAALAIRAEIEAGYAGEPYAALASAKAAVAADPGRAASHAILSDIRAERGAGREANAALRAAIAIEPDNAALHARLASALLQQNRVRAAKREIDRATELDPSLAIVGTARGQYLVQTGHAAQAEAAVLAASADNPGYARALVQLAEIDDRLDDDKGAAQQLDAADRLDPDDARVPLARTAIAVDQYSAGAAIASAREAMRRFQARGGVYSSLSEDRTTGSQVSRAFRFGGMDDWGRYYGDRVFDSFTASSYFDQALNRTPDPFVGVDVVSVGFDADNGKDLGQLSSFLQGLAIDPLAVTAPRRHVAFAHEAFAEESIGGSFRQDRFFNYPAAVATADGLTHTPFPLAYSVTAGHSLARFRGEDGGLGELNLDSARGWIGLEPGPYEKLVGFVNYERSDNDYDERSGITPVNISTNRRNLLAFGFASHEFGARNTLTIGGGYGDKTTDGLDRELDPQPSPSLVARGFAQRSRFIFATASYARSAGRLDLEVGAEAIWSRTSNNLFDRYDFDQFGIVQIDDPSTSRFRQQRYYADARWSPRGSLIVEGQIAWVDSRLRSEGANFFQVDALTPTDTAKLDFRIGAAFEPRRGHWLRSAFLRETSSEVPFTFAPTGAIGLRGNIAPVNFAGQADSAILRWDAEWDAHVFTSMEYQHQAFGALIIPTSDDQAYLGFRNVRIDRVRGTVNVWPGGNVGLAGTYAFTRGRGDELASAGLVRDTLPYLPGHFAQGSVSWTSPARVKIAVKESWSANQRDFFHVIRPASFLTDAELTWEPWDKRIQIALSVENIFGSENTPRFSIGRVISASLAYRF